MLPLQRITSLLPGSSPGSKQRRFFSIVVALLCLLMTVDAVLQQHLNFRLFDSPAVAYFLAGLSVFYFCTVIIGVIFLTSADFSPAPVRLMFDTFLSITFTIFCFGLVFRFNGITSGATCNPQDSADTLYFSMVTFSTLGYGDFRPCLDSRLFAALQAIIGNLHMGLIVGSAFLMIQNRQPK